MKSVDRCQSTWIGLAASYDRLGRFDLADRAYAAAAKFEGETPRLLNNEGYSYMLRGDLKAAHAKFQAALRLEPNNQTTLNGLAFGATDLPRDAKTSTRFQLSPWDPAYGGFAGALVSVAATAAPVEACNAAGRTAFRQARDA